MKSVLQAIPTYILSCFLLPNNILSMIEGAIRRFWWGAKDGKYIAWLAWTQLCLPRESRGMGFKNLRNFNIALLGARVAYLDEP